VEILETKIGANDHWVKSRRRWGSKALEKIIKDEAMKPYRERRHYRIIKDGIIYYVDWSFIKNKIDLLKLTI